MDFKIIKPSPILSPYIKHYWAMENCLRTNEKHYQRIIPNGFAELTFYFGDLPEYIRNKQNIKTDNMLNGQQASFYDILITGKLEMLSVVFQPYGTKLFFDIPSNEVFNQSIPAEFVFGKRFREMQSSLMNKATIQDRIALLEKFLLNQLTRKKEYELNRISDSIALINKHKGELSIDALASRACLSEKQFKRTFEEFIGISPKKFLRIIRFQHCLYTQQCKDRKSLTELAYECGYYDQSHMINDFKNISGLTPKQYFSECKPYSDYFS